MQLVSALIVISSYAHNLKIMFLRKLSQLAFTFAYRANPDTDYTSYSVKEAQIIDNSADFISSLGNIKLEAKIVESLKVIYPALGSLAQFYLVTEIRSTATITFGQLREFVDALLVSTVDKK